MCLLLMVVRGMLPLLLHPLSKVSVTGMPDYKPHRLDFVPFDFCSRGSWVLEAEELLSSML